MLSYSQLGTTHRTAPCREYPGEWLVFCNGNQPKDMDNSFSDFESAFVAAQSLANNSPDDECISICWCADEDDPRHAEVWFSGFYQHGKFDRFAIYINT